MNDKILSRRGFLKNSALGIGMNALSSTHHNSQSQDTSYHNYKLRKQYIEKIEASRQNILDELKPTKSQLEHGLELHYNNFVADIQGCLNVIHPYGINGERMEREFASAREKIESEAKSKTEPLSDSDKKRIDLQLLEIGKGMKAFDSAFDEQEKENQRNLYLLTGVNLATEDVAHPEENTFERALQHIARANFVYEKTGDVLKISGIENLKNLRERKIPGVIFHLAGVGCFAEQENPVEKVDLLYALGIRMSQLTYNQENNLCCSWIQGKDTGLKPIGKEVVRRMNELGIMIDLAHAGAKTSYDVIDYSTDPVLFSHTGCLSVFDPVNSKVRYFDNIFKQDYMRGTPKPDKPNGDVNVSDEIMQGIGEKGGLIGLITLGHVMTDTDQVFNFGVFVRHLERAIKIAGVDHVGIGTDRGFFPTWPSHAMNWENFPFWTVGLVCRGFSDDEIKKIIGGNYLRFAERVLDKKPWGRFI